MSKALIPLILLSIGSLYLFTSSNNTQSLLSSESQESFAEFQEWKEKYNKKYDSQEEEDYRYSVFLKKKEFVLNYNKKHGKELTKLNFLADLPNEEYRQKYITSKPQEKQPINLQQERTAINNELPSSLDWADKGVRVFPHESQNCKAFAPLFSALGTISALKYNQTGQHTYFSAEEYLQCDIGFPATCDVLEQRGMYLFYQYAGLMTDYDYPFTSFCGQSQGKQTECYYDSKLVDYRIGGSGEIRNDPQAIQQKLVEIPLSVSIDPSSESFQMYSGYEVYRDFDCGTVNYSTAFLSGYNDNTSEPYWIITYFLGPQWGDKGKMMIYKDMDDQQGMCGMYNEVRYPLPN